MLTAEAKDESASNKLSSLMCCCLYRCADKYEETANEDANPAAVAICEETTEGESYTVPNQYCLTLRTVQEREGHRPAI